MLLVLLASPVSALATELPEGCEPDYCAVEIKKGEPALFAGQLVTNELLAELVAATEVFEERLELERTISQEILEATVSELVAIHQVEINGKDAQILLLQAAASENEWWESPFFWLPVGLVVGGSVVVILDSE